MIDKKAARRLALLAMLSLAAPAVGGDPPAAPLPRGGYHAAALAPGETHAFAFELAAGEFLHVVLEQDEVDLVAAAYDPSGRPLREVDNPYGRDLPESLALVAREPGLHRLEIRPYARLEREARYRLRVEARRPASAADRARAEAEETTHRAHLLAGRRDGASLRAAIGVYRRAREAWRRLGAAEEEARVLRRIGQLERRLGEIRPALATLEEALAVALEAGDAEGVASIRNEMGRGHRLLGENERALELYRLSLTHWQEAGDASRLARLHNNLGAALTATGRLAEARDEVERALVLFRRLGEELDAARALSNLAHLETRQGRLARAVELFEEAHALSAALGRRDLEADVANNLGLALTQLGELHAALESFGAALEVFRELGDGRRQAAALNSQAGLLLDFGLPEEARQLLLAATRLLAEHGDPYLEGRVLLSRGNAARDLGELEVASELFGRARDLLRRSGDRHGEGLAIYHQARARHRTGHQALAHQLAAQALTIFREVGSSEGEVQALRALGRGALALGRVEDARTALERSAALAEASGEVSEQARSLAELGRLERDQGRLEPALAHLEDALARFESLRARLSGDRLRSSYFAAVREAYEVAVDTLMLLDRARPGEGFDRRAWALSESARARGLLDLRARAGIEDTGGDPELRAREKALRRQLASLAVERRRAAEAGALDARIVALTAEYRLLESRLAPEPGTGVRGPALSPHFLEEVAALLGAETVLLEVALGEPRSYLWVLARGGLQGFELPGRAEIEALAERTHRLLGRPAGDRYEREAAAGRLSRLLLGPAFEHLAARRWVIVAEGSLSYVPFAALPVPRGSGGGAPVEVPLMAEHEVVILPSAAYLAELRRAVRRPAAGRLAVLADPVYGEEDPRHEAAGAARAARGDSDDRENATSIRDPAPGGEPARLAWSSHEARAIAAEAGGEGEGVLLALGFEATLERALSAELGRYRVVHFATHGVLDSRHPQLSGLELSRFDPAGRRRASFLHLDDIYPLRWHTELVVLSGCQTALGREVRGEGLVGLAHGFQQAGAAAVIASLWPVRDRAAAELMRRFYRGLFREELGAAAALRAAQLSMWEERRWRDPYFWAPFVLIGDWRAGGASA